MFNRRLITDFFSLFFCSILCGSLAWACPPEGCDVGAGGWQKMEVSCGFVTNIKEKAIECFEKQKWIVASRDEIDKQLKEGYIAIGGWDIHSEETGDAKTKVFAFRQWAIDSIGNMYLLGQLG